LHCKSAMQRRDPQFHLPEASARRPLSLNERFSKMPAREPVKATFPPPVAARRERIGQSIVQQQQAGRAQRQNLVQERRLAPVGVPERRAPAPAPAYAQARASAVVPRTTVSQARAGRGVAVTTRAGKVVSTQQLRTPARTPTVSRPILGPPVAAFPTFPSLFPTPFRSPFGASPMGMPMYPIRPVPVPQIRGAPSFAGRGRGSARGSRGGTAGVRGGAAGGRGVSGVRRTSEPVMSKTALDADMDNYFKAKSVPLKPSKSNGALDAAELARAGQPVPESFQEELTETVEDIGVLNS